MKKIKIGNLIFNKRAILLIVFGFFLNGIVLGFFIGYSILQKKGINVFLLTAFLFLTWLPLLKPLKNSMLEIEQ